MSHILPGSNTNKLDGGKVAFAPIVRPKPQAKKNDDNPACRKVGQRVRELWKKDPLGLPPAHYHPTNLVQVEAVGSKSSTRRPPTAGELSWMLGVPYVRCLPAKIISRTHLSVVNQRVLLEYVGSEFTRGLQLSLVLHLSLIHI